MLLDGELFLGRGKFQVASQQYKRIAVQNCSTNNGLQSKTEYKRILVQNCSAKGLQLAVLQSSTANNGFGSETA
eukprot:3841873-Rhodomonas_salina.2